MNTKKEFDINAEYEKIHIPSERKLLYSKEEYNLLREKIASAPNEELKEYYVGWTSNRNSIREKNKMPQDMPLPFSGVKLVPYQEWSLHLYIEQAKKVGHHIYYLKKEDGGRLVSFAAGYYEYKANQGFYVIKGSFFPKSNRHKQYGHIDFYAGFFEFKGDMCYEKYIHKYKSASIAAKLYLGNDASLELWKDEDGISLGLDKKYINYVDNFEHETKPMTEPITESGTVNPTANWKAHTFYLRSPSDESYLYDAQGHYDIETGQFTIMAGSMLSLIVKSVKFDQSAIGLLRKKIISTNCNREKYGYRLLTDVVCKDPIWAASIVIGKTENGWSLWKDSDGLLLSVFAQ